MGKHTGCPVSHILFAGPDQTELRDKSAEYFAEWIDRIAAHAERLGENPDGAQDEAKRLFVVLQGGWTLARANENSDILRDLSALLFRR